MQFRFFILGKGNFFILFLGLMIPLTGFPEVRGWTGAGGNALWSNPLNWSSARLPDATDDVLLDNADLPGSYQVILPDQAVTVRTITITPAAGNNIELILPATNKETDALTVTGPGYGILLNAGAVFRNASGIAGGEALHISDSIRINDGGEYIHNTRASHANSILEILSSSPGTEKGVFEFDVPRASYTISLSNRTYGTLVLSAGTYGLPVNYTASGNSPLRVGGDLRVENNVSLSVNLSGPNGNMQVNGDYVQEGGVLNLASGTGNSTFLRIKGDLIQSPGAIITATSTANPGIELNGNRLQLIAAEGFLLNGLVFRVNNPSGCKLLFPLLLPHLLDLQQGRIISSVSSMLSLAETCNILVDSSLVNGPYVDGPLRKEELSNEPYFLFPVGKNGNLRWMELKQATGNFTVEYMDENPVSIGAGLGSGIAHVSKMEYWKVEADDSGSPQANMELSFVSPQSGGVTDPAFLDVSAYSGSQWLDAGHSGTTGDIGYGSVISNAIKDFTGKAFTLASTVDLENPLPLTQIQFEGKENNGHAVFSWSLESPVKADHFDLLEETGNEFHRIVQIQAIQNQIRYTWSEEKPLKRGRQYYKLNMVDERGNLYPAKTVSIVYSGNPDLELFWVPAALSSRSDELHFRASEETRLEYHIISMDGRQVKQGSLFIPAGEPEKILELNEIRPGIYQFYGIDQKGRICGLRFMRL
ncbi:MAG: hypothetical protein Q8918_17800 [Bacteroidota bacterium]|nr:hypothetical protein [Bacteroidota bacterium]